MSTAAASSVRRTMDHARSFSMSLKNEAPSSVIEASPPGQQPFPPWNLIPFSMRPSLPQARELGPERVLVSDGRVEIAVPQRAGAASRCREHGPHRFVVSTHAEHLRILKCATRGAIGRYGFPPSIRTRIARSRAGCSAVELAGNTVESNKGRRATRLIGRHVDLFYIALGTWQTPLYMEKRPAGRLNRKYIVQF